VADNVTLNSGSGGSVIKTDDDGTAHWQYVKVAYGADNTQTIVGSTASNPFPVALSDTDNAVLDNIDTATTDLPNVIGTDGAAGPSKTLSIAGTRSTGELQEILVDAQGEVQVDIANYGTTSGSQYAEGNSGFQVWAVRNDTLGTLVTDDNDYGPLQVNASGALYTEVSSALPTGSNQIGKLAANSGVDIGDVDVLSLPASTNTLEVVGDVAHDAAAAGNPVAVAARATNSVEGLTQVAAADASFITSDLNGCVVTRPHTTLEEILTERVSNTNGTSTDFSTFAAGGAGIHNYITTISIYNSSSTDGYVDFRDGAAGSVIFTAAAPQTGGSVITFPVPLKFAANTAVAYDVSGALTTVYISVVGFQAQG
jgi:hypothetical protein